MYNEYQESEYNRFVMEAKLRGVDIEKEANKEKQQSVFQFKDPSEYEKLDKEKRRDLTDQMLGRHKSTLNIG
jgi:hypothetical protein